MSAHDTQFRTGIDRMNHPLSDTAAVVGGAATVVLTGCVVSLLSDSKMFGSSNWWSVFVLSASVVSASVIGYFRPDSRVIYVPVVLAGLVTFGLCLWHLWSVYVRAIAIHPAEGLFQSVLFFTAWLAWTAPHRPASSRAAADGKVAIVTLPPA